MSVSTAKLARAFWSANLQQLEPAEFQVRFDAIYSVAQGLATLWQLGGAANDYLRVRPESIRIPPQLTSQLLAGDIVDGRIVGLKLLNRCSPDARRVCLSIERALASKHESEICGGLYELGTLLDRVAPDSSLPAASLTAKLLALQSSRDDYVLDCAARLIQQLAKLHRPKARED